MNRERSQARWLFVVCWAVYTIHWAPFIVREHFPAMTLAKRGTLNVAEFVGWTPDIFSTSNGAYITNNPGASLAGAVPLLVLRPLLDWIERDNQRRPRATAPTLDSATYRRAVEERRERYLLAVAFITVAGVMAPLSALAVAALFGALRRAGVGVRDATTAALVYGLGTPVFFRTAYLNHNLLVAHAGLLGFLLLSDPERRPRRARAALSGAAAGFAVLCDYSGLLVLAALAVHVLARCCSEEREGRLALAPLAMYACGAAPGLLALAVYQAVAFGAAALPAQHYMPPLPETLVGYRGIDWPSLELAWSNLFDPRFGLFVYCPLLMLALAAPWVRAGRHRLSRGLTWLVLGFFVAFLIFCAANQYSALQWTTGFRYMVPVVPGLLILSLQVVQTLPAVARNLLVGATLAENWALAVSHASVPAILTQPFADTIELAWLRRMRELDLVGHSLAWSAALLVATVGLVAWVSRRATACAS